MSLTEAVNSVLSQYIGFSGRARRSEYWFWTLAVAILEIALLLLTLKWPSFIVGMFFVGLAVFIPSVAVAWRRLHDTGRSGLWFFISLVPAVGSLILLVFLVLDSQPGPNQYGPNPKEAPGQAAIA